MLLQELNQTFPNAKNAKNAKVSDGCLGVLCFRFVAMVLRT